MSDRDERIRELVAAGRKHWEVAEEVGVHRSTVGRVVSPERAESDRRLAREAKRRRKGVCERCGGETNYGGKPGQAVNRFCWPCGQEHSQEVMRRKSGTGPVQRRLVSLLREADAPLRFTVIRDKLGISTQHTGPLLDRMLKLGLVQRVSRGRYTLPDRGETK